MSATRRRLRARSREEISPLVELCRKGQLFEVHEWIAAGKPVNRPEPVPYERRALPSPLEVAVEKGFHSLVRVLLEAGALNESRLSASPIHMAIHAKRMDLIELMLECGMDMSEVDMDVVFGTWDPNLMEYFIGKGADMETGNPLAVALSDGIRTALKIYFKYKDRYPSFREQLNIALRHHAGAGHRKWIALTLWAGADPYAPGLTEPDDDDEATAVEYAVLSGQPEAFDMLTRKRFDPDDPDLLAVFRYPAAKRCVETMERIVARGFRFTRLLPESSRVIQDNLEHLPYGGIESPYLVSNKPKASMVAIRIMAEHGARWMPSAAQIKEVRKVLLKMPPAYVDYLAWVMTTNMACDPAVLEELLRTPAIQAHIAKSGIRREDLRKWFPKQKIDMDSGLEP